MNAIRRAAFGRQPLSTRPGSSRSAAGKDAILRARHRASQLAALAALRRAGRGTRLRRRSSGLRR